MENDNWVNKPGKARTNLKLRKMMKCFCSGEQLQIGDMVPSLDSPATKDYTASVRSSRAGEAEHKLDTGNIEEAESSLRESGALNYEEARALLGRYEYQKGNIEAALHVFEGIDIASVTTKMKVTLAKRARTQKKRSQKYDTSPMSIHAVSLLLEAVFLKAKSLQALGRCKEAAQSCTVILDIVECSLPEGLPENFGADCKLQETLSKAVELLPQLWILADAPKEAIMSYRRALLCQWNLDVKTNAKIKKDFAIFLLYSGNEYNPPSLRFQMDNSFVPRTNIEEAILLLVILLREITLQIIEWDPSIFDHLSYALSISGALRALANQVEELLPRNIDLCERHHILALCYYGEGDNFTALNLLRKLLNSAEDPNCVPGLLLASRICAESLECAGDGINFSRRAIESLQGRCDQLMGVANYVLGLSLSAESRAAVTDSERVRMQADALQSLESAGRLTKMNDSNVIYHLCVENAEQRKLDTALHYARCFLELEGGSTLKGWMLLARVLSAQKKFPEAETIIDAAVDQSGKWDQGELLRTKAKLQIAQGQVKNAIGTYGQLLAVLQIQKKSFGVEENLKKERDFNRTMELETWHDIASIYIKLSQWQDAEICLSKSEAISCYSASRLYIAGMLHQSKGLYKAALTDYTNALAVDPSHVPSLISTAVVLRQIGNHSPAVLKSYLRGALRLDRMNASAWHNLGLIYKEEGSAMEAAECFQAACSLEETEPIEPFSLNLLTKPTLLPCDHIFCNFCVPSSTQVQCECPVCKHQYVDQEIRAVPHMESMISIFRNLDATFNAKVVQFQSSDAGGSLEQSPVSVNADKSSNEQSVKAIIRSKDLSKEIHRHNGHGMLWNVVNHLSVLPSSDMMENLKSDGYKAEEIDLNQLQQQSPGSAHSSDSNKDIVKEANELRDIKSHTAKRLVDGRSDVVEGLMHHTTMHENVFHKRDVKRQKKLSYGLPEMALQSHDHNQQRESPSRIIANSDHNLTCKLSESSFVAHPQEVSDQHLLEGSVCAFCYKSKITEGTGPMLHYANGREVVGDATSLSKAIPVHMKCIDWAPQVYYDGEIIKNLEAELARASKLKCSGCGLKGAALGCLVKSCRRSYHMPCAFEMQDCRWDCDNFVMLCPSHKSVKFPSEKSKSRKRANIVPCPEPAPLTSERLNFWATLADGPKEWVLCGSALSSEEKYMLVNLANMCGATVCKSWNPNVTHVIAATDEKGACTRTLKVLMAILGGKWILTIDWIKACIQENYPVNEEPYEVSIDNHGCTGGPKAGRLRASSSAPKLFDGLKFYLSGDYVPAYKTDLLDLVEKAGGSIIHTMEQLVSQIGATQTTNSASLVVYNSDPPHGCAFGEESNILLQRQAMAEELAKPIGCQVIQHTWILESIAASKLVPFC